MNEYVNLVIRAKMLLDGLGGAPVSQGLVAIAGEKIVYAGTAANAPAIPPSAQVLDLPEACLMPGLIDIHSHPTFYWEEPDLATYTDDVDGVTSYPPVMIALLAASNIHKALMSGVTTLRDTGSVDDIMFDVKRAVRKGLIPGPRLFLAGRLIIPTGGHCHNLRGLTNQADGSHDFRRAVREEIRAGADFIKLANDKQDLTQEELNAAWMKRIVLRKRFAVTPSGFRRSAWRSKRVWTHSSTARPRQKRSTLPRKKGSPGPDHQHITRIFEMV